MALSNIAEWNEDKQAGSACGSACGAGEKPEEKPAVSSG
ncbi:unknown [Roseburia sp. CAG:303]|nr:unknown [Roseburia sp. CAG:303]